MIHARIRHYMAGIFAIVLTIALALSTAAAPASARSFDFKSAGSMVQQPLPSQWACATQRALTSGSLRAQCRESAVLNPSATRGYVIAPQRGVQP